MDYLSLTLRLTLTLVCLTAAAGKLRSWPAFVASVEQVARSVPVVRKPALLARRWTGPTVAVELAVALLLPWPRTALAGTVLAVGLFGALTVAVTVAAARGTAAPCACFGRIARPLGKEHVARNAALTVVALLAVSAVLAGADGRMSTGGAVACAVAAAAAAQLFVHWDGLPAAPAGPDRPPTAVLPPPGTPVPPAFTARSIDGSLVVAADFAGPDVVVAFLTSPCASCHAALPRLRHALAALPPDSPRPVAVLAGSADGWPDYRTVLGPLARVVESGDEVPKGHGVADLFDVRAYPSVLLIGDGVVRRSGMAVSDVLPDMPPGLPPPELSDELPDLTGRTA